MAYDDIDFGSIIGDRANLYETADGKRFMATDAERTDAFNSLGLTRQKKVVFKGGDGYNHAVSVDDGFTPDDNWMREHDAKSIVKTETPDNYVYRVNTYALPDGQMTTVREDQDEEFRDWATKTYGAQPTLQTHARVNGIYVSGANDQINEVLRMAKEQETGLTAEQLAAIGVTEEQANAGIEAMLASKDTLEERVKKMGEIGFAEAESHDRGYRKLGHEIDGEWDATKATLATGLDIATGLLDIGTLGFADVVRTPEVMIQVYGNPETGLQALKDRAWVNKQADLARMAVGDAEYDKLSGMSDEELHEYFKNLLTEQRKMEYLDSLRGRTTGANVGTTITGTAESGLDFWASTAAGSAAGAGLGAAVGTVAPGLGNAIGGVAGAAGGAVAGATGYLLSHAASERDVAKTSKMAFDPITGKLVEYAPGMSGGRAAVAGIVNPLVEWGVERVGGKIGGKLLPPVKGGLAKAIGRDRAILFGIMPGVASRPANTALEKLAEKTAAGFRRFAAGNTWGAKLANLTGNAASRMTPGAIGGELFEEYLQAAIEGGFNLRGELVDEYGELAGMDLGNAAAAFMDVFRTTPELALGIALYGAGSGVAARGYGALVDGYATKATMKKWLEKWGYDKAAIRSMSSEEMKTHFMDAITKPGEDAGKRAEEFLKDKSGKALERLARSAFATSTNGYDIVETTDENGKKSFALVRNTWMAKLKPGETHKEAESRTQPVVFKSNSREEVESKLRELLVENAKQNGLYTLTVNPAMDDVTRAAMHITRGRQSEIRRVVQEMGMDKAFAGWGNSADVYDLLTQAITLRMAASSTNVRGTDYARFLRFAANHLENMAASTMASEYGKGDGRRVFTEYMRYMRGASVVPKTGSGGADLRQVFKNPDDEKNAAEGEKWSVDDNGAEYIQKGDVRLERSLGKDHKYTYRVRMTGKYSSAPYYYSEAGKAFARANAMHESVRSFEQEYEERKRRANQMYDELFGTDDDSRSGFTVVETVWEDPQAAAEIIEDLAAKGMTPEQAMAAMNKKAGVRLKSGRIVVFLNNINSLAELAATIRHEAMHGGLEAHISEALGGDKAKALKFLKDVSAILREAGVPIKGLDGAALSEEDLDKLTDAEFRLAIDEALAALAETVSAKSGYSGRIFKIVNEAFHDKKSLDGLTSSEKLDEARNILFDAYMRVNARDIGEDMDMAHAEEVVRSFQEKAFNLDKWKTPPEPTGDETGPEAGMGNKPRPDVPPGPKPKWGDAYDVFYGPDSGTAETEQVPVASISVNDRIKQFKRDADPETGIVEGDKLSGQWSDEFGQPIRLMRFKDGHLEVITGRHRLELAKRNGMDTIPARIYNETDGMTVDLAKAIDAIENIQAGKGSETDFITFFIKSHLDRRIIDALQLNTSENTQIKAAWDIATKGVNGLISYALIPSEGRKVGILALGAIAEQPANIQMQLLAEAHNDTTGAYRDPVFIRQFGQRIANAEHYEDVELFGEDDPAIVQMKLEAIGIKTIIKRLEGDLQTINNAINSRLHNAIRPELVKRYGIKDQRDKKELRQVAAKIRKQIEAYESPSVSGALLEEARKVGKEELEKINKRNKARGVQDIMSFINDFSERPLGKGEDPNARRDDQPPSSPEPEPAPEPTQPTGGSGGTTAPTPTGEPDKGTEAPTGTTTPQPVDGKPGGEPLPQGVDHVRDDNGYIQWSTGDHNAYKLRFKFGEGPGSRRETKGKTVKGVYVYDTNLDGSIRPETEEFYELLDRPYTSKGGKVHYGQLVNRNHQGEGMRSAFGNMWNALDAWAVAGYPGATEEELRGTHLVGLGIVKGADTGTETSTDGDGFTLSGEPGPDTQSAGQQDGQQEPEDPFSQPPDYTGSGMAQDDLFGNTEGQEQQPAPEPAPTPEPEPAPETELPAPVNERGFDPATYGWSKGERDGRDVTKDDFKKTFGFNKVTIGKKGAQGQKIANAAYDAFVALAKAANIPYEAISLGGYIKSVVLGVYHADRNGAFDGSEIRINKDTDGFQSDDSIAFERASSIIHEWAHALDAALSRGRNFLNNGGNGAKRYMSNREETLPFTDEHTKPREILPDVRADMVKAYDKMLDALMDSGFWHRVYETQKTVNYPRRPAEMFARAIQAYITALHAPEAIRNVYLDHMKLTDTLSELAEGKKSSGARRSIYPYKDEVEELAPAFDAFFGALRVGTNEATGKMTLYRESEEAFPEAPRSTLKDRVEIRGAMAVPFAGSKASIVEDYPELFRGIGNAAKEAGGRIIDAFAGAGAYTAGLGALNALPQGSVLNEWAVSRYVMHKMLAENPEAMARAAEDIATRFVNSPEMAEVRRRVEQANKDGRHVVNLTQPVIDWFYDELNGKHGTIYVDGTDNTEFGDAALRETPESAALYQVLQSIVSSGYPVNFVWKKGELKIDVSGGNFRSGQVGRVAEKNGKTNKWRMSKPGEGVFNVKRYPERILNTGRIYQQNGVQVTRGDGWALAKTARRGDVVLVDPAYLGTQSYGGKKNVDATDANDKDVAIEKLVDLIRWADSNGASIVYTNELSDKSGMGGMSRADYEAVWREALDRIGSDGVAVNFFNRKVHGMRGSQAPRADVVFATGRVAHLFNVSNAELASIKARHGFETDEEAMARAMDERTAVLDDITDSQESDDWRQTLYRGATDDSTVERVAAADAADFLRREAKRMSNVLRGALTQGSRDRMAQWLEEAFINAQAPVFRLYRRIVDDLPPPRNAKEAALRDELNIEAAIKNEPGRIRWRREKLKRDYLDRINRILKQGKCDANLFSDYLYFHYVPERNAMLYARETTTDESGDVVLPFDPVTGEEIPFDQYKGSGYSNEEAKAGIERIEQMPNGQAYKDAAKLVWEMNQNTLRELVQAGIIAQRQGERWMRDAPHYVPLKDIDAMDRKSALFSLRVVGRKIGHVATANTWAASAYQALEAQSMIERNNTKVKFLRFLKTYDPDGKHIKWWHLTNPGNEKEAGMEDAVYVSKYDEEYQKLAAAGVHMVEAGDGQGFFVASGGPSDYSKGKLGVHIRNKTKQGSNAVLVMQNGRRTYITFDASVYAKQRKEGTYVQPGRIEKYQRIGDADWEGLRIAEAMNDANKRRFDIPILSWATRFKARISTSWNPNFIIGNIPIDIINTVTIMGIEGRWKEARQFLRNYKSAMKTVYQYQRDRSYTDKQMGKYLEEAMQGGMMTGTYGQSFAAVDEDFRNAISGLEGGAGRIRGGVQGLVDKLDKLSNVAEIGTRLAVYAAMRMNGMNKNEAAQYGREITVDFNANGNYTPVINTLYMFSNAAAQSFVRYVNAVKYGTKLRGGGAKGLAKTLLPVIALHMALGFLIAMLNDADEGEGPGGEDESTERRIPDYVWEGGMPISLPFFDGYLNVPMRGALVPFMKAGRDTYEMFKGRKEATEVMGNLISGTLESTVNIFGQSPNLEQWISPTALDPFVQIMTGKDWTGRELYRRDYGQAGSDAHLGLGRTPSLYHWMAKGMNAATGGNDVEGGLVDWRPETYKLLTDFFLGSLSGYALNSVDMVHGIGKGELPRPNDIPFVGRVLRETPGVSNRYYTALGESAELERIYRKRVADSKSPELSAEKRRESAQQARGLREEHRWLKSVKAMGDLQRRITERRDRSKEMEDGPRKEAFDKETERLMGTWLRVYERR